MPAPSEAYKEIATYFKALFDPQTPEELAENTRSRARVERTEMQLRVDLGQPVGMPRVPGNEDFHPIMPTRSMDP